MRDAERVDIQAELDIYEVRAELKDYEIPEGYTAERAAKAHATLGLYKVYVKGLNFKPLYIPDGYYLVREEFASKLLRNEQRQTAGTGLMFTAKRVTVEEFYRRNDAIELRYEGKPMSD